MKGFRVWDKEEKKMFYDDFVIGTDGKIYHLESYTSFDDNYYILNVIPISVHRYILMSRYDQCNKNGVPLYENDILENEKGDRIILNNKEMISNFGNIDQYVWIGNIFEN